MFVHVRKEFQNISTTSGHGVIILRICNELIRRTPKSNGSLFCGSIRLFLSRLFPYGERSGMNLRGELNISNVTFIEPIQSSADSEMIYSLESVVSCVEKKSSDALPYSFYKDFWRLQSDFLHPIQTLQPQNWKKTISTMNLIFSLFENLRSVHMQDQKLISSQSPKHMSSQKLLTLQLTDDIFRQTFLIQSFIFCHHILTFSAKNQLKFGSTKTDGDILTAEKVYMIKRNHL